MRLLHQWLDHDRGGAAAREPASDRTRQIRDGLSGLKCRCGTHMRSSRGQARGTGLRENAMNKILNPQFSRRRIIQGAGLLVVSTGMPIELRAPLRR